MANGKVITGYSLPKYYKPTASAGQTTDIKALARGVDVNMSVESADAVTFYADNGVAECIAPTFTTGTLTMTVDGLKEAARDALFGITTSTGTTWETFTNEQKADYVAVGFIVRYVEDSQTHYIPFVLPRVLFKPSALAAATQEDAIAFQTESLEATVYLNKTNTSTTSDPEYKYIWKYVGKTEYEDEATAETALIDKMKDIIYLATT